MPPKTQNKSHEEINIYKTIEGKREPWLNLKKGDDVLMRSSEPGKPHVARVEAIETDSDGSSNPRVQVKWFYRPEESKGGRKPFHGAKEVYLSDEKEWQSTDTIEGKCNVLSYDSYTKFESVDDDVFFYRVKYYPRTGAFNPNNIEVYCKCENPCNPDDLMVQCENCEDWFHPSCIGTTIEDAKKLDHFCCEECSKKHQDLNNSNSTSKDSDYSDTKRKLEEVTKTANNQNKSMRFI